MSKLWRILEERFEEAVSCLCLAVMATCVFAQVVARYVFSSAISWTEELAAFSMVWAVYMGACLAVRERFHIRVFVCFLWMPRSIVVAIIVLSDLCWMTFNLLMVWNGVAYIALLWQRVYISPSLHIDQKWPQMIIVIGYVLMSVRLAQIYYNWFKGGRRELPGIPKESQLMEAGAHE